MRQLIIGMILTGMSIKLTNKQHGYTLIEMMLYMGIVVIVFAAVVPFALNVIQNGQKSGVGQEVYSNARYVSERLKDEIRNAFDVNAGTSNFDTNLASVVGSKISLKGTGTADPVVIDVFGGRVRITKGAGSPVFINSGNTKVSNLTFVDYSSADGKTSNVGFTLTMQTTYAGASQVYKADQTIETAAEIRNN
jgi:type II secretory pathway pseudopilin PulG